MKISIIQTDIVWEDKKTNLVNIEEKINSIIDTDLVILPEMFTTGFSMIPEPISETMDGETINWMKTISMNKNIVICGSIIIKENNRYYNRFVWVEPNGNIMTYDKRHLFSFAGEDGFYSRGDEKLIIEYKGLKICPLICYDLRFPVFSRNVELYDVLIYVANWPSVRINTWKTLLSARAIENQSYVIGVNRIGIDKTNTYNGNSLFISPNGEIIHNLLDFEKTLTFEVDKNEIISNRNKYQFLKDQDKFKVDWGMITN